MAHSCRWRFPARPGGSSNSGTGRRAGRVRVNASLRSAPETHLNTTGVGPGFDAAIQVSSAIGSNLQKFEDVLGESSGSSSGEEEVFVGFGTVSEHRRIHSPSRTSAVTPTQEKKPRGRPPRALTAKRASAGVAPPLSPASPARGKPEGSHPRPGEKVKRLPGRPPGSGEKRRGRPPASGSQRGWQVSSHAAGEDGRHAGLEHGSAAPHRRKDTAEEERDRKATKRTPLGSVQTQDAEAPPAKVGCQDSKVTKLKRLKEVKLSPLKSRLKSIAKKGVPVPGVPRRRRGRPPSAERLKAEAAAAAAAALASSSSSGSEAGLTEAGAGKQRAFRVRRDRDTDPHTPQARLSDDASSPDLHSSQHSSPPASPSPSKQGRPLGLRQSPRHIKPVRIVPPSKRTDAAIAKQLLQRAKKGAQKKKLLEKEVVAVGGPGAGAMEVGIRRRRRTQLKNIRQFIMPVVSTVSLRIIKTPKRFIEDEGSFGAPHPHMKVARLEPVPSAVLAPPPQPASTPTPSPMLVSTATVTTTAATAGTPVPADAFSLPPPPPPTTAPSSATAMTTGLLNNSTASNGGRFSSSAASCGSSAVSQHSSQLSSGESSRSSSPSLDDSSCDSQASEGTQALSEPDEEPHDHHHHHDHHHDHNRSPSSQGERDASLLHASRTSRPPSPEPQPERVVLVERGRRGRRGQRVGRGGLGVRGRGSLTTRGKKAIISPATGVLMSSSSLVGSQQASSTASSSSSPPPPPLLTPLQPPQSSSNSEHQSPWILPPHFLSGPSAHSSLLDKRRSILREPTFRWTSLSRSELQYFSSAKYAKEGLIRKPIFDNFRPPPLTAEDVGLMPSGASAGGVGPAGFPTPGGSGSGAGTRLFSPLHHHQHPSSRYETPHQKRSPLLRAPRFTPSEAHSRIFESVTLQSSSVSSPGSLSPLQSSSGRRRRMRRALGTLRGQPHSPSHSMTRRSSQPGSQMMERGSSEMLPPGSISCGNPSSLPGVAAVSASSALPSTPFSTFPSSPSKRAAGNPASTSSSSSTTPSSSQLFPVFAPSPQEKGRGAGKGGRERNASASREQPPREKDRETERSQEREKENKREGKKDWEKRGKASTTEASSNAASSLFTVEGGREMDESLSSLAPKKTPGRKKSCVDSGTEAAAATGAPADLGTVHPAPPPSLAKGRLSKKGRPVERGAEAEPGEKEKEREKPSAPTQLPGPPGQTGKQPPAPSLGSMLAQAEKQQVTDKRVVGLLKKAKDQLFKIEKSKSLKSPDQPKVQGQESDSSETSVRGPRIKHVCRRAAVALGRNLAVFPDDMPTLSALPWEEREKILSSMGNDDKSSVAGSEEAEPQSPPIKPVTRHKTIQEAGPPRKGRRSRRCGQCPGCQVPEDCGVCTNCLDKPKFGGRNIKKQCCKVRKCQNLQWMPSKMFLQKQVKGKKDKKKNKLSEKKEGLHAVKGPSSEPSLKPALPSLKEDPPRKKNETPPPKPGEERQRPQPPSQQQSSPAPTPTPSPAPNEPPQPPTLAPASGPTTEPKQPSAPASASSRKERKLQQPTPPSSSSSSSSSSPQSSPSPPSQSQQLPLQQQRPQNQAPPKKDGPPKSPPTEPKRKSHQQQSLAAPTADTGQSSSAAEVKQLKKLTPRSAPPPPKRKPKDKQEKPLAIIPDSSTLNSLSTPSTGGPTAQQQRAACDGVHRIRVDFKRDYDVERVWETGGLSLITSVPITPRVVCFLCASSGNVEFVFCQVCCEPFHLFCLGETERPLEEQLENWCCRRCRFCHTCGRQHQKTNQQLLECDKCRNSYHPECLGPNHPTKKKRVWMCTACVRCKSCGATKPGKAWDAQWSHDFSLCHDCAKLFAKGNFCPLCDKCYDDDDYDSKMMQCGRCDHWVHSKCENLTDEMYELMSKLPESVAYICTICTERPPAEWRTALEKELQGCVRQVLTALLNSCTSTHLLRYRQAVMKPPELNPETEESLPSRRSPEGPDPPVLTEVKPPSDTPLDLESVEKKMDQGRYKSVLEFSDDIVKIVQTAMNTDGGQPESRKANSMVKSFFTRQMERVFPWFKVKESRFWETHKVSNNSGLVLLNAVLPPSLDHNYAQWQEIEENARAEQPSHMKKIIPAPLPKTPGELDTPISPPPPPPLIHDLSREDSPELLPPPGVSDNRQCVLCLKYGDENTNDCGRLLYIGQNEWTHVNCALWSAEVFEDDDGSLKNVHMAVLRGKQLRCENCQRPGATVGCCLTSCTSNYHFMCARQRHCVFLEDKKVYCYRHRDLIKGEVVSESGFEVTRRILVDLEGISLRRKFLTGLEPENVHMMIGSMTIDCLGILTELSDCEHKLFPIGYQCSRVYWSTLDARKRCVYTCRILVCRPPVVEPDLLAPEKNHTIGHSPPPLSDKELSPQSDPFDSPMPSEGPYLPITPKLKVYTRNQHPSYPPCQRSPGSRPLPSPGGSSQSAHEIVTVGDPLLSSTLRSIGSRHHSTSSLYLSKPTNPQPTRERAVSPPCTQPLPISSSVLPLSCVTPTLSSPPPLISSTSRELSLRDPEKSLSPSFQHRHTHHHYFHHNSRSVRKESGSKQAGGEKARAAPSTPGVGGVSLASPPLSTAVLTGQQRERGGCSRTEKGKQGGKEADPSSSLILLSRHRPAPLPKDRAPPAKEGSSGISVPAPKDTGKSGSSPQPTYQRSGGRRSHDSAPGPVPAAAMKPLWSSGATVQDDIIIKRGSQAAPPVPTGHTTPSPSPSPSHVTKDKQSKARALSSSREVSKEKEKTPHNSNKALLNNNTKAPSAPAPPTSHNSHSKAAPLGNNTTTKGLSEVVKTEKQVGDRRCSKSRERISSPERKKNLGLGMVILQQPHQQPRPAPERGPRPAHTQSKVTMDEVVVTTRDKKRTVKGTLMQIKTDPNGTNTLGPSPKTVSTSSDPTTTTTTTAASSIFPADQGHQPHRRTALFSSPSVSSESSESDGHPHPDERQDRLLARLTEDEEEEEEGDGPEDGDEGGVDKHHEDDSDGSGSAKRRYPRRSARARSNMFFGLTPFYGVRSYGEEDIPFYTSGGDGHGGPVGKRRAGGGSRRSAEGQVDGADDISTSSSGDSGAEEEGGVIQCSAKDPYYYNFTRTIINPGAGLPSIEGIDQCLGRGSQLQRFLKDEEEEEERKAAGGEEGRPNRTLNQQQIGQLDGVDDGSESDASVSATTTTTSTTTTAAASSSHKGTGKRKARERDRHATEKLEHDAVKETENSSSGGGGSGGSNSREASGRKSQKDNCLPLGGVKTPQGQTGQDPLEAQLSLSTDLLKSDSDNNNSDDCGNILPSDIMEFVLNTPSMSMQALGQQAEPSSSELLSLDESYAVDVNRRKDILFEDFPQPLASVSSEAGESGVSGVSSSISVEEPYGLPLELPSDLSVLTTRSPTVNNQNHSSLITEGSDRNTTMLQSLTSNEVAADKGGEKKRGGAGVSPESQPDGAVRGSRDAQGTEGHMTPEHFIPERISSPALGQVVEPAGNQEGARNSGTPGLPSSPTLPLQGQKYLPIAAAASSSPGLSPSQGPSTAVHATPSHLKAGTDKLIVVNQHLQPLYVLQTLPNGVTRKIQITPCDTGAMETGSSVLSSMTLTTGLSSGLSSPQPMFPAGGNVLGTMPHHPQIHTFTGTTQTGYQTAGSTSTTSGLLIGVPSSSHDPQILVSQAGHDLGPNVTIVSTASSIISSTSAAGLTTGHGKKRPISRLQPRKTKKLPRPRPPPPPPPITLINLSPSQVTSAGITTTGIPVQPLASSHRNVPNIIKRPKSGVMYLPGTLLQQRMPLPGSQPGILGHDSSAHLLPCSVAGINPSQPVLNVVSMPPSSTAGLIAPGSVSLSTPVLSSAEITGPISNLLFKAGPHNLGISEQQMVLQSGGGPMMTSLSGDPGQTTIASSIRVLPSHQTVSMSVSHRGEAESALQLHQPIGRAHQTLEGGPNAPGAVTHDSMGRVVGVFNQTPQTMPFSILTEKRQELKPSSTAGPGTGKGKQKAKRPRQSPDKASGKKHKPHQETQGDGNPAGWTPFIPESIEPVSPEPMDTGKPKDKGTPKNVSAEPPAHPSSTFEFPDGKDNTTGGSSLRSPSAAAGEGPSSLLPARPGQEGSRLDSSLHSKPKKGLLFEIRSDDGFQIRCDSIEEAWKSLTDKVQEARSNARLKELSFEGVNGLRMLGVLHDAVVFLLEQLYGSRHCRSYRFRFHKPQATDEPPLNPHGSARAESHNKRSMFDAFNFLASKHRQPPEYNPLEEDEEEKLEAALRATTMVLPLPLRFRQLKRTSKEAVGVYRSTIHGRGLFCRRTLRAGEMVIEYSGSIIRSVLTDKREKYYDGKGTGCYMFRIDDYEVVDATAEGNAARFINHSCEPNCYARVVNVDGQKHIIIFALRKIYCGEELTYDYKFPIEEPTNKLPCNCGANKCRKFLN